MFGSHMQHLPAAYHYFELCTGSEQVYDLQGVRPAQRHDLTELAALAEALDDHRRRAEVALRQASFVEAIGDPLAAATAELKELQTQIAAKQKAVDAAAAAFEPAKRALAEAESDQQRFEAVGQASSRP